MQSAQPIWAIHVLPKFALSANLALMVVLGIAVGLALDAFAVALATGVRCRGPLSRRQTFRLAFYFGLFQAIMPIFGWFGGRTFADIAGPVDHWIAFALLTIIGVRMISEGIRPDSNKNNLSDPTRGWSLIALSLATSIDALAVGISLAFIGWSIFVPALVIGLVTAGLTTIGALSGHRLGTRFGHRLEIAGGLILIAIGALILFDHISKGI